MNAFDEGTREVPLIRGGERVMCVLRWVYRRDRYYELLIDSPVGPVSVVARDLFVALQEIRRTLEPSGWRVAVQGSRRNAWASGMLRDMIGARRIYLCVLGEEVVPREAVDIFAPAEAVDLGTVDEQVAFFREWRDSRRKPQGPA